MLTSATAAEGPPDSVSCQTTFDQITIEVGDGHASYSYTIDTSHLPAPVQGLTLVMCEKCYYMMENDGMNVGGIPGVNDTWVFVIIVIFVTVSSVATLWVLKRINWL